MAKEVVLTRIAAADFNSVVDFLISKWDVTVATDFVERFDHVVDLLSHDARIFPFFDREKQLQRCVLTKHNILYFRETEQAVLIYTIFDTRQNPEKLNSLV